MVNIGQVEINGRLALAPMAGVSDVSFRELCRAFGAAYSTTEMVSAKALVYKDQKTRSLLQLGEGEHPAAAQIFGSEPEVMEEAAGLARVISGADVIDVYAEVNEDVVEVFVRDRGHGFDLDSVPEDRHGLRGSIVERMGRHHGTARITSDPDRGTEVSLEMKR